MKHELNDIMQNLDYGSFIGVLHINSELKLTKFTGGVTSLYNISETDILRSLSDLSTTFKEKHAKKIISSTKETITQKSNTSFEILTSENTCILVIIAPYIVDYTKKEGAIIHFIDITKTKELEQALSLEKDKLTLGYSVANFAICEWDLEKDLLIPNSNWFNLLGQHPPKTSYSISSFINTVFQEQRDMLMNVIEDFLLRKTNDFYRKIKIFSDIKDSYLWFEVTCNNILFDETNTPIKSIIFIHEITSLIKQESEIFVKDMALNNSMLQTLGVDNTGSITYANSIAKDTLLIKEDNMPPLKYWSVIANDALSSANWSSYYNNLKAIKHHQFEGYQIISSDKTIPVIISESYVKYKDYEYIFVFILNITETVEAKQKFEQTLELYKMTEDIAEIGYMEMNLKTKKIKITDGIKQLIGGQKVTIFSDFYKCMATNDIHKVINIYNKALITAKPFESKLAVTINNKLKYIHAKGRFICDKYNKPIKAIILIMNITDTVLKEKRLLESEEKFKSLFQNMSSPCTINQMLYNEKGKPYDFRILDCNNNFLNTFSLTHLDVINSTASNSIVFSSSVWFDTCKNVVATSKEALFEINYDELEKYYIVHVYKHSNDTFVTIFTDISKRKELEKKAIHNEKMAAIGQLAGGVAHDFNNQLMGMQGALELIKYSNAPAINKKYMKMINNSISNCTGLINKLLTFSKKREYVQSPIDIHVAITKTIDILSLTFDKKITIESNLNSELCYVMGDFALVESCFMNMMINSRDAMSSGGKITITTSLVDGEIDEHSIKQYIKIEIEDTGHGIDSETQKKIFEPFFTTKGHENGNGMGLSTVYGTIEKMNGIINFESQVNKGTTFYIYLPVIANSSIQQQIHSPNIHDLKLPYSIMLVDDESIVRNVLATLLRENGINVIDFEKSTDALAFYEKNYTKIDLVFLDMIMPDMNGVELLDKLVLINGQIKAILLSGFSADLHIEEAHKHGFISKIQKPIEIKYILKEIIHIQTGNY